MLCQKCKKKPAAIHVTRIVNQKKTEWYLCYDCAKDEQSLGDAIPFSVNDLINGILSGLQAENQEVVPDITCAGCQTQYHDFLKTGRFGCPQCYRAFETQLSQVIKKIQGGELHKGKIPQNIDRAIKAKREITQLRKQLMEYVEAEAFEKAAVVRDQIKDLEKLLTQPAEREDVNELDR